MVSGMCQCKNARVDISSRKIVWSWAVLGVEMSIPPIVNSRGSTPDFCEPSVQPAPQRTLQLRSRVRQCQKKKATNNTLPQIVQGRSKRRPAHRGSTIPLVRSMTHIHGIENTKDPVQLTDEMRMSGVMTPCRLPKPTKLLKTSIRTMNTMHRWDLFFSHRAREKKSRTAGTAALRQDKMQTQRHVNDGFDVVSSEPPFHDQMWMTA